nr:autotransporter outer membrane beta-barrel domain-containing protein [Desulfovibrionaceae bacterium]
DIIVKHLLSLLIFLISTCVLFETKLHSKAKSTILIPYGSLLGDLYILSNVDLIFLSGVGRDTSVGNIELLGPYSYLFLQSATVYGYISLGEYADGETKFYGTHAYVEDGISLYGEYATFTWGDKFNVNNSIAILGEKSNTVTLQEAYVLYDISIGASTQSINTLTMENTHLVHSNIYLDGAYNNIKILGNTIFTPSSHIYIRGSSDIYIASPLISLDSIHFETPDDEHHMTLASGFSYIGKDLIIPLPDKAGNSLTIEGSTIEADIVLSDNIDLSVIWSAGTSFLGTIYGDSLKTTIRGVGLFSTTVDVAPLFSLPTGFILGLQGNSVWNGDLAGEDLDLGVIDSYVNGNITLDKGTAYLSESTISGSIDASSSSLVIDDIIVYGKRLSASNSIIRGEILFTSPLGMPNTYEFSSQSMLVEKSASTILSTYNSIVGDSLKLYTSSIDGYTSDMILFVGDADFNNLVADTLILDSKITQRPYTVDYIMINPKTYTDHRRIENVLQGFTYQPTLYRNTMNGYDVVLVRNEAIEHNYDLVLLGFSQSNDAFSGAYFTQSIHTRILEQTTQRHVMDALSVLTNPTTKGTRGFSVWGQGSFHYIEKSEKGFSPLKAYVTSGIAGLTSAPITITDKVTTMLGAFFQISSSKTTIYDIKNQYSHSTTSSFIGNIFSTWNIQLFENHSLFFSIVLGGGSYKTTVTRPYAATEDKWTNYMLSTHAYLGYTGKYGIVSFTPYLGIIYNHITGFSLLSADNTKVTHKDNHLLSPSVGLLLDIYKHGMRPYIHTFFALPFNLSKAKLSIQDIEREYTTDTSYNNLALGFEYTHMLRYSQFSFLGEVGVRTTLSHKPDVEPHVNLSVTISF